QRSAITINLNDFLAVNLNSSAACGILSNPIYAQGAIATIAIMDEIAPTSGLNSGCMLEKELEGFKIIAMVNKITPPSKQIQKINWVNPDKLAPRIFTSAKAINAIQAKIGRAHV